MRFMQVSWWEGCTHSLWVEIGLVLMVGRPCLGLCLLSGSSLFRNTLSFLSTSGCVSALLLVWSEASQHRSLQAVGWGQVLVRKWQPPREPMPVNSQQNLCCQCPCSHSEPQLPLIFTGHPPNTKWEFWPNFLWTYCFIPWVLVGMRPCVHLPRVQFLFPPVLHNFFSQSPLSFKDRFSGDSSFCCHALRLWRSTWGSELSLPWKNFFGILIFQSVSHLPGMKRFDFIMIAPLLPSLCGFFFVFGCSGNQKKSCILAGIFLKMKLTS